MSPTHSSILSRRPSQATAAVDLDVTPIMNMFIILVPFLVSMAVFAHLATHRFSLPSDDASTVARTAAELPLTVLVTRNAVEVSWGDHSIAALRNVTDGTPDVELLLSVLVAERVRRPEVTTVTLSVDDLVVCGDIVAILDQCLAAGYDDVGLADGSKATAMDVGVSS